MTDIQQLVRVSRLYYELGETQGAIAEQLGVTRPQVSRLLKRARAEGIVEIRIVDRATADSPAAETLSARFGLDAIVQVDLGVRRAELVLRLLEEQAPELVEGRGDDRPSDLGIPDP